jgi:Kdo2-lipid IVA lauroyltransferase/acyltransferase
MARANPSALHRLGWRLEALAYDGFSALLRLLPIDWASGFGGWALRRLGPLTKEHKIALAGVKLAFPDLTDQERARIVRGHWDNLGRTAIEFVMMDRILGEKDRIEVEDAEIVLDQVRRGGGLILISGHFANWEAMSAAASLVGVEALVSYRAANNPYVDARLVRARAEHGIHLHAPRGRRGARRLVEALETGGVLGFLNDQRDMHGVEAPLFGHPAQTAPGPARLALAHGAAIVPVGVQRTRGARFRVRPYPPIPVDRTGDREADVRTVVSRINAFMEARIRERPEQWLWSHRRWPWEVYEEAGFRR